MILPVMSPLQKDRPPPLPESVSTLPDMILLAIGPSAKAIPPRLAMIALFVIGPSQKYIADMALKLIVLSEMIGAASSSPWMPKLVHSVITFFDMVGDVP